MTAGLHPSPIGREKDDFYKTPPTVTRALLTRESFRDVWEPACGDGAISAVLIGEGARVFSSDLIPRGYGHAPLNFLQSVEMPYLNADVVTNPPYKLAQEFVMHALDLGARRVAMLLRLSWLEGERRRRQVFTHRPPSRVWVMSARPTLWHGLDPNARTTDGAMAYAWFVWDSEAPPGPTALGWLGKVEPTLEDMLA